MSEKAHHYPLHYAKATLAENTDPHSKKEGCINLRFKVSEDSGQSNVNTISLDCAKKLLKELLEILL